MSSDDTDQVPCWPALVRLERESDVTYVESGQHWYADPDLSGYSELGTLVDSHGRVFDLRFERGSCGERFLGGREGMLRPISRGKRFDRLDWLEYVRDYLLAFAPERFRELEGIADGGELAQRVFAAIKMTDV